MSKPPLPPRLASINRSQLVLHTIDVEHLVDEDHSARSIWHEIMRHEIMRQNYASDGVKIMRQTQNYASDGAGTFRNCLLKVPVPSDT